MAGSHGKLIWYELMTPDAEGAASFYERVVGWTIATQGGDPKGYRMIAMPDGAVGGILPFTQDMLDHGATPGWLMYVCVDDVDASVAAIGEAGGKTHMPPWDIPGIGRVAMLADPQGAPFYVMAPIAPAGGGVSNAFDSEMLGRCTWNELRTSDLDPALDFYGHQFGWAVSGSMPMGPMGEYKFLVQDDARIGAAMGGADADHPPAWLAYFRVANIDAAIAAITTGGGEILNGPHEVPGGDRIVIVRDPQGARVGFVARP